MGHETNITISKDYEKKWKPPYAWLQWKGTDCCVDIYCVCGAQLHYDGDFMYYIQCPKCKRYFECDAHIKLFEVDLKDPENHSIQYPEE